VTFPLAFHEPGVLKDGVGNLHIPATHAEMLSDPGGAPCDYANFIGVQQAVTEHRPHLERAYPLLSAFVLRDEAHATVLARKVIQVGASHWGVPSFGTGTRWGGYGDSRRNRVPQLFPSFSSPPAKWVPPR